MVEISHHKHGKTLKEKIEEAFKDSEVTDKDKFGFTKGKGDKLDYEDPAHRLYAWSIVYQDPEEGVLSDLIGDVKKAFKGDVGSEDEGPRGAMGHAVKKARDLFKKKKLIRITGKKDAEEIIDEYIHHVLDSMYSDKLDKIIEELKKQSGDGEYDENTLKDIKRNLYDQMVGAGQVEGVKSFKQLRKALMFKTKGSVESQLESEIDKALAGHVQVLSSRLAPQYVKHDDITYIADRVQKMHPDHVHPDVLHSLNIDALSVIYDAAIKGKPAEDLGLIEAKKYKGKK